jgi:hypothetical protein
VQQKTGGCYVALQDGLIAKTPPPHSRETDPNHEFARLEYDWPTLWFFGSLLLFMIIYVIWAGIKAA